jgi:hypothetical protein
MGKLFKQIYNGKTSYATKKIGILRINTLMLVLLPLNVGLGKSPRGKIKSD